MRIPVTLLLLLAALLAPAASAEDLPMAVTDPPAGAVAPDEDGQVHATSVHSADPADPAEPIAPIEPEETVAAAMPATTAPPRATTASGAGSLPVTGPDPRQLVLVLLVGLTSVLGGIVLAGLAPALAPRRSASNAR